MKIFITGHGGLLAQAVFREATEAGVDIVALTEEELDITDRPAVEAALEKSRPDAVINCAAWVNAETAQGEPDGARAVNTDGAGILAAAAAGRRAIVYPSTDYVFDGEKGEAYVESDEPRPAVGLRRDQARRRARHRLGQPAPLHRPHGVAVRARRPQLPRHDAAAWPRRGGHPRRERPDRLPRPTRPTWPPRSSSWCSDERLRDPPRGRRHHLLLVRPGGATFRLTGSDYPVRPCPTPSTRCRRRARCFMPPSSTGEGPDRRRPDRSLGSGRGYRAPSEQPRRPILARARASVHAMRHGEIRGRGSSSAKSGVSVTTRGLGPRSEGWSLGSRSLDWQPGPEPGNRMAIGGQWRRRPEPPPNLARPRGAADRPNRKVVSLNAARPAPNGAL